MENKFIYSNNNKRYYTLDYFYKEKFGSKVFKVSLNGGFTCPNRDGSKGTGGCIYCSNSLSGEYGGDIKDNIIIQFNKVKNIMLKKWPNAKYIGYFQAGTNTYSNVEHLKELYETILKQKDVVGLSIATRPDAISNECLDYLEDLSKRTFLTIELGLQTIHEKTSDLINRCHTLKEFDNMVLKLRSKNINVIVHIIDGLPYETEEMMIETVKYISKLDIQGIKIHMLSVLKNTRLEKLYEKEKFHILTKDEYVNIVVKQLEYIKDSIVINRITGDPMKEELVEPFWLTKKFCVINDIDKKMVELNVYQGDKFKN